MNKKDLHILAENYGKIFENTLAAIAQEQEPMVQNALDNIPSPPSEPEVDMVVPAQQPPLEGSSCGGLDEQTRMTIANLKSLVAHGQKVLQTIESGNGQVEAWMNDKITVASNDILEVCNALEFRS